MNKSLIGLVGALFVSVSLNAQEATSSAQGQVSKKSETGVISKGVMIGLRKSMSEELRVEIGEDGDLGRGKTKNIKSKLGLTAGYGEINISNIGFLATLNYNRFELDSNYSASAVRFDGSAAYGFNDSLYIFGGLNLNKYISGELLKELDAGLGFQLGAAAVFNKNFAVNLGYYSTNNGVKLDGIDVNFETNIMELGVSYHF